MNRTAKTILVALSIGVFLYHPTSTLQAGSNSKLIEAAKGEGVVSYYTTMTLSQSKKVVDRFQKKYPFIKPELFRGGGDEVLNRILNEAGTKFEVITGYKGTSPIRIAMQSREVEGACLGWESMRVSDRAMLDAKGDDRLIPFITHKRLEDPEVKDLPLFTEAIKGNDNLATYNTWAASYEFQRPFSLPPGVPPERLQTLRKAFAATLRDPALLAEAKKMKLDIEPVSGEEIDGYVKQIYSMSNAVKRNLSFLVKSTQKQSN
jgi:hypothetical protein